MIREFKRDRNDKAIFNQCHVNVKDLVNQHHDFSNKITQKPWGYEYEILSTDNVSIQVLHINSNSATSFHCHPNKDTLLTVLETSHMVICGSSTLSKPLKKGDILVINKGAFHKTTALLYPAIVMEIETPVNKNDLVRFQDTYGRV